MLEKIKEALIERLDFNETQQKGFRIEQIEEDTEELSHPDLAYTISVYEDINIFIGHYEVQHGVRMRWDGTGEPDVEEYIEDTLFGVNTPIDEVIDAFIKLQQQHEKNIELMNEEEERMFREEMDYVR